MTAPQILCLGEMLFDYLADQVEQNYDEVETWTPYPGGAPANVACALIKLGTTAGFISCLGRDEAGDELLSLLNTNGVNTQGVQRHASAPTRLVYVTRSAGGERHFAGFGEIAADQFADTHLDAAQLPTALFNTASVLVSGTISLAFPQSREATEAAFTMAKQSGMDIFLDINWRSVFWQDEQLAQSLIRQALQKTDWVKCSDDEAQWFFGTDDPRKIAQGLPRIKGVLVTAGDRGCTYQIGQQGGAVPAFPIQPIDTTGAGDGFVAGFLHQYSLQGERLVQDESLAKNAIVYASAVGALTATKPGAIAAQPTAAEVDKFLKTAL